MVTQWTLGHSVNKRIPISPTHPQCQHQQKQMVC
jgi:hypothetical protein